MPVSSIASKRALFQFPRTLIEDIICYPRHISFVVPCHRLTSCVGPFALLALRCVLPTFCVAPYALLALRCAFRSPCVALRLTHFFLRCAFRLSFAPLVYRPLFFCVLLSLFSFPVIVRFPYLFHISLSSLPIPPITTAL